MTDPIQTNNQNTTDNTQAQNQDDTKLNPQTPNDTKQTTERDLEAELNEMTNIAKRAAADLQNYKRQVAEERQSLMAMSKIIILQEILPAIDNLERALKHLPADLNEHEWAKGIQNIHQQLTGILTNTGLSEIDCSGATNPHHHEIVTAIPGEQDKIIEVMEKGYLLGEKVIRPAKVVVGNGEA